MEIPVQSLNERMRQIIDDRERTHRGQFSAAVNRVFKSVASVEKAAVKLDESVKRAWGTLSKPAEQHGARLSEQILEACRSLALHKPELTHDQLRKFHEDSVQTTRLVVKTYNKYVPSIMRAAKPDASVLENSIAALSNGVTELGQVLDKSSLKELKFIAEEAYQLVQTARDLNFKINEIHHTNDTIKKLQDQVTELQTDLSLLDRDQAIGELNQTERQARQKEIEMLALLEPLLKPLRKIDRSDREMFAGPSRPAIRRVIENPLMTVLEIPVSEMRELLVSVYPLLERDELLLDQRRKRKAAEAIQVLQAGALERFREDHDVLEANRREILRQLKGSGLYDQWLSVRKQLDDLAKEIADHQERTVQLESQEKRLRTSFLAGKQKLELAFEGVLEKPVSISL